MKKYFFIAAFLLFVFGITTTLGSCRKKGATIAEITVRDTGNVLVPGAQVILFGTSTTTPVQPVIRRDTITTGANGVALFNYDEVYQLGQAGVAVLNIEARKNGMYGEGIIKIVEEEENKATVFIQP